MPVPGKTKGGSITVPLISCLTGLELAVCQRDNFCFYLKNRQIQTSQTGGQWCSDTSPFSIPCLYYKCSLGTLMMTLGAKLTPISDAPNCGVTHRQL
jgi:hypothetical protein